MHVLETALHLLNLALQLIVLPFVLLVQLFYLRLHLVVHHPLELLLHRDDLGLRLRFGFRLQSIFLLDLKVNTLLQLFQLLIVLNLVLHLLVLMLLA